MELATAKANHGITKLEFWKSSKTTRLVSFNKTFGGMVKFITKEDFDGTKPAYAYLADDITEHVDEESGTVVKCQCYWVSNVKGGTPALVL